LKEKGWIAVLDFGSQYSHLLVRRVRECGAYAELVPHDADPNQLQGVKGLILTGGPAHVYDASAPHPHPNILQARLPILGICYGHQIITKLLNGRVRRGTRKEYGRALLYNKGGVLLGGLPPKFHVWMSHWDEVVEPPEGFTVTASTEACPVAMMEDSEMKIYASQFHPEVAHTEFGTEIIRRFVQDVCGLRQTWSVQDYIGEAVSEIRRAVGGGRVLCAVSGGVDSTTTAVLLHKAVGPNLTCIFVNTGLLREGEDIEVVDMLRKHFGINVVHVDASSRFLTKLRGAKDPEAKRKIIGEEFIRVFEEEARRQGGYEFLAQGTLYPDVIESAAAGGPASLIKSHHNVAGLPADTRFRIIEPLKYLYKDEVRALAASLGIPASVVKRHPFPGPGLAVRIIGEVTEKKLNICRKASKIIEEELEKAGLYERVWQAFAVVGDDRATGVKGDARELGHIVTIRIVESQDAMTATWARVDHELLDRMARRITSEVDDVSWVAYAISDKPPATIEPQ
jgi:GMP synthase (glutamine-hydrolysing)